MFRLKVTVAMKTYQAPNNGSEEMEDAKPASDDYSESWIIYIPSEGMTSIHRQGNNSVVGRGLKGLNRNPNATNRKQIGLLFALYASC
jgi:hypothetical protein